MKAASFAIAVVAGCATDGASGPALTGESYTLTWGPVMVAPGTEATRCVVLDVGNDQPTKIHQIHNVLGATSHHMIVYRDDSGAELSSTPTDCTPFAGALSAKAAVSPLMISQKHDELLALPAGVAFTLAAHQRVRIEMHYFNTSDQPQPATASIELDVGAADQIHDEASFLFIGSPDIDLPANLVSNVDAFFTAPPLFDGVNFFALTGHTHRLGTDMRIETAASPTAAGTPVYAPDPFVWSEPATERHDPAFQLPAGGGFDFHCTFFNSTQDRVKFGESTTDEMCFFWAYYYPSRGAHMCVHSTLIGGPAGTDVCCPAEVGDPLAEFVCRKLAGD